MICQACYSGKTSENTHLLRKGQHFLGSSDCVAFLYKPFVMNISTKCYWEFFGNHLVLKRHSFKIYNGFNPIQAREHNVPPYQSHRISSKRLGVLSFCFMNFLCGKFPFRKFQFHQSAHIYVVMAAVHLFSIILKFQLSIVFQVFPHEKNLLWDNPLCFGHHNTLRSLIEAPIRCVTVERPQKFILHKNGH